MAFIFQLSSPTKKSVFRFNSNNSYSRVNYPKVIEDNITETLLVAASLLLVLVKMKVADDWWNELRLVWLWPQCCKSFTVHCDHIYVLSESIPQVINSWALLTVLTSSGSTQSTVSVISPGHSREDPHTRSLSSYIGYAPPSKGICGSRTPVLCG